jgi:hypothetical protein
VRDEALTGEPAGQPLRLDEKAEEARRAIWSSPEKVDAASAEGLLVSLDGDFGFENDD